MKYIITESKLKNLLKDRLGVDLSGKISMVTNQYDLPMEFDRYIPPKVLNSYLNKFGPMYVIETPKNTFLYQNQAGVPTITDKKDRLHSVNSLMSHLGIPPMGLSIDDIIDVYVQE